MGMGRQRFGFVLLVVGVSMLLAGVPRAHATPADITTTDIMALPATMLVSGNGTLDLILFTHGSGGAGNIVNPGPSFNGDDANTELPSGNPNGAFAESYVTTAGDLQDFYDLNFGPGVINQVVLFLDLDETSGGAPTNTLDLLDIILNPSSINGDPDPTGDVDSSTQDDIDQTYSGGTLLANLNPEPANNIPLVNQGGGHPDYAIFTHVNPYDYGVDDVLLFNISMHNLDNGPEIIYLSGSYDVPPPHSAPEPATLALLGASLLGLGGRRLRRGAGMPGRRLRSCPR